MATAERLGGLAVLALAVYVFLGSRGMAYTREGVPGPGFAPTWISLLIGIAGVWILIQASATAPRGPFLPDRNAVTRMVLLALAMIVAVWLIDKLGMVLTLALFSAFAVPMLGGRGWRRLLAAAVVVPAALHFVFRVWLKVPFPKGPLGF